MKEGEIVPQAVLGGGEDGNFGFFSLFLGDLHVFFRGEGNGPSYRGSSIPYRQGVPCTGGEIGEKPDSRGDLLKSEKGACWRNGRTRQNER